MIGDMRIKVQNVGRFFKNKYQKGVAFPGWRHTVSKTKKIKGSDGLVFIVFFVYLFETTIQRSDHEKVMARRL